MNLIQYDGDDNMSDFLVIVYDFNALNPFKFCNRFRCPKSPRLSDYRQIRVAKRHCVLSIHSAVLNQISGLMNTPKSNQSILRSSFRWHAMLADLNERESDQNVVRCLKVVDFVRGFPINQMMKCLRERDRVHLVVMKQYYDQIDDDRQNSPWSVLRGVLPCHWRNTKWRKSGWGKQPEKGNADEINESSERWKRWINHQGESEESDSTGSPG